MRRTNQTFRERLNCGTSMTNPGRSVRLGIPLAKMCSTLPFIRSPINEPLPTPLAHWTTPCRRQATSPCHRICAGVQVPIPMSLMFIRRQPSPDFPLCASCTGEGSSLRGSRGDQIPGAPVPRKKGEGKIWQDGRQAWAGTGLSAFSSARMALHRPEFRAPLPALASAGRRLEPWMRNDAGES